ncbi:uncharacterized protein ACB058_007075 [Synchiropus picturatus]
MVHSDSTSQMKVTPPASLQLTVTSAVPPQVLPSTLTVGQNSSQTPNKCNTDPISDSNQPSTGTPAEPHVVSPAGEPTTDSSPVSDWPPGKNPVLGRINGRTSARKRTPKACDCCGPNSKGHNVETPSRGQHRGRGRGRRGIGTDHLETSKRKLGDVLTPVRGLKLFKGKDEDAEHVITNNLVQVSNNDSDISVIPPVLVPLVEEPISVCVATETSGAELPVVSKEVCTLAINTLGNKCPPVSQSTPTMAPLSSVGVEPNLTASVMELKQQVDSEKTVLNGTQQPAEAAGKSKEEVIVLNDSGNGTLGSETPQDMEFLMQVDEYTLVPLSNGVNALQTNHDHGASQPRIPPPTNPIAVNRQKHVWALLDHQLYCHTGTWEKGEEQQQDVAGHTGSEEKEIEERLEQLVDMVHEFLESFYIKYGSFIPLSESDVLGYLKMKSNCEDLSNMGLNIKGEMARYQTGLASAPFSGFMVMYNKHSLSLEDLATLEDQNWVNDQIINMYGELIMENTQHKVHFFNSFFHKQLVAKGYDGVKRWTKKVDLFSKWLLLIPIHLEIHWSLVTVTMATKTINYYDSQGIVFRNTTDNILKYLQAEAQERNQAAFQKGWKIFINKNIPQQKNDSDCGVFVLEYCRCLSMKQPLLFSQDDMPHIRKRIYKELCDCRLVA